MRLRCIQNILQNDEIFALRASENSFLKPEDGNQAQASRAVAIVSFIFAFHVPFFYSEIFTVCVGTHLANKVLEKNGALMPNTTGRVVRPR